MKRTSAVYKTPLAGLDCNMEIDNLRQRIETGERVFPENCQPLLESLKDEMGFTIGPAGDRPSLNKRGGLPQPQKCVVVWFGRRPDEPV